MNRGGGGFTHVWNHPLSPSTYSAYQPPRLLTRPRGRANDFSDSRGKNAGTSDNAYATQRPLFALRADRDHLRGGGRGGASAEVRRRSAPNN